MSTAAAIPSDPPRDEPERMPRLGEMLRSIFRLGTPSVLENLLSATIVFVDLLMLARLDNNAAYLASAGVASVWLWRVTSVFAVTQVGSAAYTARRWGEGATRAASRAMTHATVLGAGCGLLGILVLLPLAGPIAHWYLPDDPETAGILHRYLFLVFLGLPFRIAFVCMSACLRAAGDTITPLVVVAFMVACNAFLNWMLIFGNLGMPRLEMDGAAIGTALTFAAGFAFVALRAGFGVRPRRLFPANEGAPLDLGGGQDHEHDGAQLAAPVARRGAVLRLRRDGLRAWMPGTTQPILRVSGPALLEEILVSIGFLLFIKMVASFGAEVLAAHAACLRIETFSFTAGWGVAVAASAMVGQSLGARRPLLARRIFSLTNTLAMVVMGLAGIVMALFPDALLGVFRLEDQVLDIGRYLLFIVAMEQCFIAATMTLAGGLRGAGDTFPPFVVQLVGTIGTRLGVGYLLAWPLGMGIEGVYWGTVIDWLLRAMVLGWFVWRGKWAQVKV